MAPLINVVVFCAFLTFPLIAKELEDNHSTDKPAAVFPLSISLWDEMQLTLLLHTNKGAEQISMRIPSPYCLQQPVKVFTSDTGNCDSMLRPVLSPLIRIFGFNYIQILLGLDEQIVGYPTWGSFLIAVMEKAETHPLMQKHPADVRIITKYKETLNRIMPIIFLPLIAMYKEFNGQTLWLKCRSSADVCVMRKRLSDETIASQAKNMNEIAIPIINPVHWLQPVDDQPIRFLFNATIYPELEEKLLYHNELFNEGHLNEYLGSFPVNAKRFPNKAVLAIHVLYELEKKFQMTSDTERWKTVNNYLTAMRKTALSYRLPDCFLKSLVTTDVDVPTPTIIHYEDAPVFPKWLDPMDEMVVHPVMWPLPASIGGNTGKNNRSIVDVTLPSVYCSQFSSSSVEIPEKCKNSAERWVSFMTDLYGETYTNFSVNSDMKIRYPTIISYFAGVEENVKLLSENRQKLVKLGTYQLALEFALPYINLPLIANYLKLDTEVVWITIHSENKMAPIIQSVRPKKIDEKMIILPLVNPRLWHLPVDTKDPYTVLIPNLQADDPYSIEIEPLRKTLRDEKWYTADFTLNWNPKEHHTRGLLFINALYRLSVEMKTRRGKNNRKNKESSENVRAIVENYRTAIRSLAFFVYVPPSYIEDTALKVIELDTQDQKKELPAET